MSWAIIGASLVSAGAGVYGSQQAAAAQGKGGDKALAEQQRQFNIGLNLLEPQRALGYGAQSDLASLYGYALPQYTPANQLLASGTAANLGKHASVGGMPGVPYGGEFSAPIAVDGRKGTGKIAGIDVNPFSRHERAFGGTIDPVTGTVDLSGKMRPGKEAKREAAASAYLRGESDKLKGKGMRRIRNTIDSLLDQGYEYRPSDLAAVAPPTAGPTGQPGNFDRFFASPDYLFRQQEGARAIDRSAAARGQALGANTLRAQTEYASNLAGSEYGNYFNRLMGMAGLGQTATTQAVQAGQNYANQASNAYQQQGDARASGIMGATNSAVNALGNGMNLWMLQRYMNQPQPTAPRPAGYTPAPGMGIMPLPPGYY